MKINLTTVTFGVTSMSLILSSLSLLSSISSFRRIGLVSLSSSSNCVSAFTLTSPTPSSSIRTNSYYSQTSKFPNQQQRNQQQQQNVGFFSFSGRKDSVDSVRLMSTSSPTSSASASASALPDVDTMKIGQLKVELESYGINTKIFLEKKELIEAVQKARADGLQPKTSTSTTTTTSTTSSKPKVEKTSTTTDSVKSTDTNDNDGKSREERIKDELEIINSMKATEIKKELISLGINVQSFFEKSEFAQALAIARVDDVVTGKGSDSSGYAEYSNVEVLTDANSGPRPKQSETKPQSQSQSQSSSPFGGMGGMGGMGGIADMLKNMGGMGGGMGGNPFGGGGAGGGGGGNPFGGGAGGNTADMMGKAQQMMSNPKVREIITKAQSNPQTMKKINDIMSNPLNFTKYQNDPDVSELINELRKFM